MDWSLAADRAIPGPFRTLLRGVGQVFFCCNAVTGLVFLVALYIGGVTAGLAATAGVLSSTVAARLLRFPKEDIDAGLYGFNGTLVGPCLFLFLENSPQLWLYLVLASILSTIVLAALTRMLQPYHIPASTSPFILTCWMFIAAVYAFDSFARGSLLPAAGIPAEVAAVSMLPVEAWPVAVTRGISEVMFVDNAVAGVLFLAGIAINSLRGAVMALSGAIIGIVVPVFLGADNGLIEAGLYAYNPVLVMMAVGWVFLKPSGKSAALAFLAGIFTVICQAGLASFLVPLGLPVLTFPFVLIMWVFLLAASKARF
ncbi:urea transporter [Nitrosomonas sp.]|uniref:urea transporter n=1 Tax=Nitrosomonas sp. TaxID=42353 RepID=UPI0025D7E30A|nr:urea transporter [Nitrosomonas sp.]MCC6916592.1 urea transporter [Nitrosomonas sp.]